MSVQSIGIRQTNAGRILVLAVVGTLIAIIGFSGALLELVHRWADREEYSHGFLIPVVAVWLLWVRRDALRANIGLSTWTGPVLIALATAMHIIGLLSATPILSQVGFVVALVGLVLGLGGYSLFRTAFVPIVFLLFAIPLPAFVDSLISLQLQFISSELGTFFIRMFRIPVYLDGNIIDLGYYKIQVVEACSGLRYLYPLMSLSFLVAYLFKAPFWQRGLVFLSSIPITIILNGIRVGMVGVTVNYWGSQAADGLLHFFEGWIVFLACGGLLALEISVLTRISGKTVSDIFYFSSVTSKSPRESQPGPVGRLPIAFSLLILCSAATASFYISGRKEVIPERSRFVAFPEQIGAWRGRPSLLDAETERLLHPDDYILSDYVKSDGNAVNFYVVYYASQRTGTQPHSPSDCIPASGWRVTKFNQTTYIDKGVNISLNRAIIEKDSVKQLVYYWFDERGRNLANEYWVKWYIHADAAVMNRTDGALVRLITRIDHGESERVADERLQAFIQDVTPALSEYLPAEAKSQQFRPAPSGPEKAKL
jgi:exosortase D (VPLPA-CTERM-specific)